MNAAHAGGRFSRDNTMTRITLPGGHVYDGETRDGEPHGKRPKGSST